MSIVPKNYSEWKLCITEKCKIPLTMEFVKERIEVFTDEDSDERAVFIEKYGPQWANTVLQYYRQALRELN